MKTSFANMQQRNQMSDNAEVQNIEQENQTPQYTEIEQRALEMGWRPKEEFDGDEIDFVDAKEFISRKPLYDKISQQSKQIKNVNRSLEALKEHYTKVKEVEFQNAIKALKAERKVAMVQGDGDAFDAAEKKIEEAEAQFQEIKQAAASITTDDEPVVSPIFQNWKNRNPWYDSTGYMRSYADDVGKRLHASGMHPDDILKEVEKAVRKEFPTKFSNPNKADAPDVGVSKNSGKGKGAEMHLTEQEKRVMDTLVRGGHITKEKYLADLKKVRGE